MELKTAKCLKYAKSPKIATDIKGLDTVLGGGLKQGKLYELVGRSGCGKTQLWQVLKYALIFKFIK